MKGRLFFWLLFVNYTVGAQVTETFTDGDFSSNPIWQGDTASWKIQNGVLCSKSQAPNSTFFLSTGSELVKGSDWKYTTKLLFNTSGLNYVDVYLTANSQDLNLAEGYFVRIGNTKDEICLYKKIAGQTFLLIDGIDGSTNASTSTVSVKVRCSENWHWTLETSINSASFKTEGSVTDSSLKKSAYFGIYVKQSTASFFGKHEFDNILVQKIVTDTVRPQLVSFLATADSTFIAHFSEAIDQQQTEIIVNGKKNKHIKLLNTFQYKITFDKGTIVKGQNNWDARYTDMNGNTTIHLATVVYNPPTAPRFREVLINEILADPSPPFDLPEAEFVELYNTGTDTLSLSGCTFSDVTTTVALPAYNLLPGAYVILHKASDSVLFNNYPNRLSLPEFPTLNNSGDELWLKHNDTVIDYVSYADDLHTNSNQKEGGYSLESINPDAGWCAASQNWTTSRDKSGGTPGKQNSVYERHKDTLAPEISSYHIDSLHINLVFSEPIDTGKIQQGFIISINNKPLRNAIVKNTREIIITHNTQLQQGKEHTLTVGLVSDCAGNTMEERTYKVLLPEQGLPGDIILNEVLFNPLPYGSDFIEVYNVSSKKIDLKNWKLATQSVDTLASVTAVTSESYLLNPQQFVVFAKDKNNILQNFPKAHPLHIIEVKNLPSYPDEEGTIVLLNNLNTEVDRFAYSEEYHLSLLTQKEGVSLERIQYTQPTQDRNNWISAASTAGYGTPTQPNSQHITTGFLSEEISVEPLAFTPDGDGDKDVSLIRYKLASAGHVATVIMYDVQGRPLRHLARNVTLPLEGQWMWDGTDDAQRKVPVGYYIAWIELLDNKGNVKHHKEKIAVGARF